MSGPGAYALLLAACVAGVLVTPLALPGTWLIVVAALVFGWATDFQTLGWPTLATLAVIAAAAEVVEFLTGAVGARRYGGSRRAAWLAIAGGLVGGIAGASLGFGLGAVPGALLGAFAGAFLAELTLAPDVRQAGRVGWGALVGRAWGMAFKGAAAVAMAIVTAAAAWR